MLEVSIILLKNLFFFSFLKNLKSDIYLLQDMNKMSKFPE